MKLLITIMAIALLSTNAFADESVCPVLGDMATKIMEMRQDEQTYSYSRGQIDGLISDSEIYWKEGKEEEGERDLRRFIIWMVNTAYDTPVIDEPKYLISNFRNQVERLCYQKLDEGEEK